MSRALRVGYMCVWDPDYPRNRRIREYLERQDDIVVEVVRRSSRPGRLARLVDDVVRPVRTLRRFDVVIVAEYAVVFAPAIAAAARLLGVRVVVDGFVSKVETVVEDWQRHTPRSLGGRFWALVDRLAARLPQVYLTDTQVRADAVVRRHGPGVTALALPVGAPDWAVPRPRPSADAREPHPRPSADAREPRPRPSADAPPATRVLFYGLYVPLHGLDTIVRAAAALRDTGDAVTFTLLGDGELRPQTEALVAELGLADTCTFRPPVREDELAAVIAEHDVVLGVFGASDQARTVIPNKVWQGLACGRTVVTRESPALAEIAAIVPGQLVEVPAADPEALAAALRAVGSAGPGAYPDDTARRLEDHVQARFAALVRALRTG